MNLKQLSVYVSIKVNGDAKIPRDKRDEWQKKARGYSCTLGYDSRNMTCNFFMGSGRGGVPPTSYDVLYCLLSDASSIDNAQGFEDWASDLGYDSDSRSAEKTYEACVRLTKKLRSLLGDDYETFLTAERE